MVFLLAGRSDSVTNAGMNLACTIMVLPLALLGLTAAGTSAQETTPPSETEPVGALGIFKKGVALAQNGDYRSALQRFEQAQKLAPGWALPYLEIAVAHLVLDNDRKVIQVALENAVKYGSELPRARYMYGIFLQEAGRRNEAIAELTRALELRPGLTDARFRLATLYVEGGHQNEGIEQYLFVVKDQPAHLGARKTLAILFEQSGQFEKAEEQLKLATNLYPDNAFLMTTLGQFYKRMGWTDKAKAAFSAADRLEPNKDKRGLRPLLKSKN